MTNQSDVLSSGQPVSNSRGVTMRRFVLIVAVALASLTAGACAGLVGKAGKIQIAAQPVEIVNDVAQSPSEPVSLPVRSLSLAQLLIPPALASEPTPEPKCDRFEQIDNAEELLKSVELTVGTKEYRYAEKRAGTVATFKDPEKQIALELLDPELCTLSQVIITKRGDKLIAPPGYEIEVVTRINGIRWNNWATEYRVKSPAGLTVIANTYPLVGQEKVARIVTNKTGKRVTVYDTVRTITPVFYTPYSKELHVPEMVAGGREYLTGLAKRAHEELRRLQVPSQTTGNMLVADVSALKPEFTERLVPNELMDLTEFILDPTWTTERMHVVIGANRDRVASYTCSKAKACGLMQFTSGTYALMAKLYPEAELNKDFVDGARDPLNAMKAAVLLHDHNLAVLVNAFGDGIVADPKLEEYLAAAYNTGVGRVKSVLAVALRTKAADWAKASGKKKTEHLLGETKGYITKLRFLRDQWPLPPLAKADTTTPDQ